MASLALLRKKAKEAGVAAAVIRRASTAEELQSIIEDHDGGEITRKPVAKKKGATVAKKKSATKKSATTREVKPKPAVTTSRKKSGKAKRSATGTNGYVAKGGRNLLDSVDFSETNGWNAREGSAPSRIIAALKKARGNREKAFEILKGDIWDFVGKKMADGSKRSKQSAEAMLRYRISRTLWDFAMRTGQHEKAANRVEYGTGGTGTGAYKPARKAARKVATKSASKKSASKKSASKKATSKKSSTKKRSTKKR